MKEYFDIISNVADKEMSTVGQDINRSIPATAMYIECVRRIQVWTLEELAIAAKNANNVIMSNAFIELANGINSVPDVDLWLGELQV